jgi:hypothetical protein
LRNSTARNSVGRSAQNDRTVERWFGPGFIVTIRKIADRVSGAATGCGLIIAVNTCLGSGHKSQLLAADS